MAEGSVNGMWKQGFTILLTLIFGIFGSLGIFRYALYGPVERNTELIESTRELHASDMKRLTDLLKEVREELKETNRNLGETNQRLARIEGKLR